MSISVLNENINYGTVGAYGLLGNDYSPAFFGKGKVKPFEIMMKSQKFTDAFATFGEIEFTESVIEEFVCGIYGYKRQTDINEVRHIMFEAKSKPQNSLKPLDTIKSIDPTSFPPCRKVLDLHMKRAWYIARLYKTAITAYTCYEYTPIDFGWRLSVCRNFLEIDWFHGDQLPCEVESIADNAEELEESDSDSDSDSDMVDSDDNDADLYF